MSITGLRPFRPQLHFSAPSMWINDPNGLVYVNGTYHLFYQYHPFSTVWGPMHWGHAVSSDLLHWSHRPIALAPDELGTIFSGSAVYDKDNTSGFGALGCAPIVLIYTQNLAGPGGKTDRAQHQSIAYSLDGINFIKYEHNPVIPCPQGETNFRDPKVFKNPISGDWCMVLACGDHVEFYRSPNLINWKKSGSFGPLSSGSPSEGVWECPDIIFFDTEDGQKAVLILSLSLPAELGGSRTAYLVGSFDGNTFHHDIKEGIHWLDEGFDNYAGVTFQNTEKPLLIGWANNWKYAADCPTNDYCGTMTLARQLNLVSTPKGWRLAGMPINLGSLIRNVRLLRSQDVITSEVFGLSLQGNGDGSIQFENPQGQTLSFGIRGQKLFFDRSQAGDSRFSSVFAEPFFSVKEVERFFEGSWKMDVIFDISQIEIFIDNGTLSMCSTIYPDSPYNKISFLGDITGRIMDLIK